MCPIGRLCLNDVFVCHLGGTTPTGVKALRTKPWASGWGGGAVQLYITPDGGDNGEQDDVMTRMVMLTMVVMIMMVVILTTLMMIMMIMLMMR